MDKMLQEEEFPDISQIQSYAEKLGVPESVEIPLHQKKTPKWTKRLQDLIDQSYNDKDYQKLKN